MRPTRLIVLGLASAAVFASCSSSAPLETSGDTTTPTSATPTSAAAPAAATDATEEAETTPEADSGEELFPDVVNATATRNADGTWTIAATLSSPYDSPERYADAWQVLGPDGTAYGERFLTHDHAGEQPFTREESGVEIPDDVDVVTIQGRDQLSGWGGQTFELALTR